MTNCFGEFSHVSWIDDDIINAFEFRGGITPSDDDVNAIVNACLDRYALEEAMIRAGWDFIYGAIDHYMREKEK